MPRGQKTDTETIYKIMVSYATTNNYSKTSRYLNIPITTVEKIVKDNKNKDEFVKVCNEKKEQFVDKATKIIDKAMNRLEERLDDEAEKINISNLSTVIGTLYDKRALAQGEATANTDVTIKVKLLDD